MRSPSARVLASLAVLILGSLGGCDDTLFPAVGAVGATGEGWCGVRNLVQVRCLSCHAAPTALGGLDLETDPHQTLTTGISAAWGGAYVDPTAPGTGVLLRKLRGDASTGGIMPPSGAVSPEELEVVERWVAEGAPADCDTAGSGGGGGYHPPGWADPAEHGLAAKLGEDRCTDCHGDTLEGGEVQIGCASCHDPALEARGVRPADWTVTCTFCHGDPADGTGAPPQDIDDNTNLATLTFPPHRVHVQSPLHADWDCTQCHQKPTSVFSPGHVFIDDDTPGVAEIDFSAGLSPGAVRTPTGCTNSTCHGDGQRAGSVLQTASFDCSGCHAGPSARGSWDELSGPHERHLDEDIPCASCHPIVSASGALVDKDLHVDGGVALDLPETISRGEDGRCTGTCHEETHSQRRWVD